MAESHHGGRPAGNRRSEACGFPAGAGSGKRFTVRTGMRRPGQRLLPLATLATAMSQAGVVDAAELTWTSPPECERASLVKEAVEALTGQPFSSAETLRFDVVVTREQGAWKLELSTTHAAE